MQNRLHEIDGIRGWAALVVLMFHLTSETFGGVFPEYRSVYFKFFLDGSLAVFVFFVLSGDALSNGYLRTNNDQTLVRMVIKRYFRLAGPILFSCLLVYVLLKLHLTFNTDAGRIVAREDWLGEFLPFDANFRGMLQYALLQVFTGHTMQNSYNPFLWPMATELYGSFFIFGILFSWKFIRRPILLVSLAAAYFFILGSYFSLFFIGLIFSILREDKYFERFRGSSRSGIAFVAILVLIVVDSLLAGDSYDRPKVSIVIASLLVFSIYSNQQLVGFFSNKVSRWLGRISFPLYITHFAVITTFTSWAIKHYKSLGELDFAHSGMIVVSSLTIAILLAEIFARAENVYLKKLDAVAVSLIHRPAA